MEVRKVIYTTNVIESLNSKYRQLNSQRGVDTSLLKALYLAIFEAIKKWTLNLRKLGKNMWRTIDFLENLENKIKEEKIKDKKFILDLNK
ncbi:hypothetical protein [Fusobacterium sp.]|uniref:hypothetical protein n=1 Tax=Fusobacterium sp. TaxID=68766 RepID=UPI0025BB64F8|nr:hypothetical protein [Fusobacterium sp.]